MNKLRPCPFCGGEAEQFECRETDNLGGEVVGCKKCLGSTRVFFGEKTGLSEAWNTRSDDALIEQMAEAIRFCKAIIESHGVPIGFHELKIDIALAAYEARKGE